MSTLHERLELIRAVKDAAPANFDELEAKFDLAISALAWEYYGALSELTHEKSTHRHARRVAAVWLASAAKLPFT